MKSAGAEDSAKTTQCGRWRGRTYRCHQQLDKGNVGSVVFHDTQEEPAKNEVKIATVYVNIFYLKQYMYQYTAI